MGWAVSQKPFVIRPSGTLSGLIADRTPVGFFGGGYTRPPLCLVNLSAVGLPT